MQEHMRAGSLTRGTDAKGFFLPFFLIANYYALVDKVPNWYGF